MILKRIFQALLILIFFISNLILVNQVLVSGLKYNITQESNTLCLHSAGFHGRWLMLHFRFHIIPHKLKNYDWEETPMQKLEDQVSEVSQLIRKERPLQVCYTK